MAKTIEVTIVIKGSNGQVMETFAAEVMDYTTNVDMDVELELVHDDNDAPSVRPKHRPKF